MVLLISFMTSCQRLKTDPVSYEAGNVTLKGYLAYDTSYKGKRPGILVVHEWWGHNEYARKRARMLATLGYTALAVDMYGEGKQEEAFIKEMEDAGASYRFIEYSGAKHSFTNPEADSYAERFDLPLGYNAEADRKSWADMERFLKEVLGE